MVDKVTYKLDLDLSGVPEDSRDEFKREVKDYILDQVVRDVANQKSPVTGDYFDELSDKYAKLKRELVGNSNPNLTLSGDMMHSLQARIVGDSIEFGIWDYAQAQKADNHNKFSSDSRRTKVPARKFIPDKQSGEKFVKEILDNIDSIKARYDVGMGTKPLSRTRVDQQLLSTIIDSPKAKDIDWEDFDE